MSGKQHHNQANPPPNNTYEEAQRQLRERNDEARRAGKKERTDTEQRAAKAQRVRDKQHGVDR
jgi:hypothetical protein